MLSALRRAPVRPAHSHDTRAREPPNVQRMTTAAPLLEDFQLFNERLARKKAFERERGVTAPRLGGKTPSARLLRLIPESRYKKITPEMWDNMQMMEDLRGLWSYESHRETDEVSVHQPLVERPQPRKRHNFHVRRKRKV